MTAGELIESLKKVDENTLVLIPGYESGYDTIASITIPPVSIKKQNRSVWYEGVYAEAKVTTKTFAVILKSR